VLFQSEIRQALITFGNRFSVPFTRHSGQFGEGVYDEVILAATTLASTKTGALIVIERNVGLKNVTDGGVQLDAELSYDLLVSIFNTRARCTMARWWCGDIGSRRLQCFLPLTLNPRLSAGSRNAPSRGDWCD
jgi:diadenylate cyclase